MLILAHAYKSSQIPLVPQRVFIRAYFHTSRLILRQGNEMRFDKRPIKFQLFHCLFLFPGTRASRLAQQNSRIAAFAVRTQFKTFLVPQISFLLQITLN